MPVPTQFPYANITRLSDVAAYQNTITNGVFGPLVLMVVWFVLFFALGAWPKPQAATAASWVTLMVAVVFQTAGLIDWYVTGGIFGLAALSAAWLIFQ